MLYRISAYNEEINISVIMDSTEKFTKLRKLSNTFKQPRNQRRTDLHIDPGKLKR